VTGPLILPPLPGAVSADPPDERVAAHYGDPYREQRLLTESVGIVDRSHRGVLRVSGADRLSWLHSLTSQHLAELPPGRGTEALVLSPHGHVEHHLLVAEDGEACWLDVEPGTAPDLLAFLAKMRFLLRVDPVDASADWAVLSVVGPGAAGIVPVGKTAYEVTRWRDGLVRRMPYGADVLTPRDRAAEVIVECGAPPAGLSAFEALRVAARRPRLGFETDHRTIPHEVGWLDTAVHLHKGCYRGQETVARVHNLGRPPRRLVLLHLDGSVDELPAHGDPVSWKGQPVGFVTTAARHFELGPIALALVKRKVPDDADLLAAGVAARPE
jgi:folate-binding protein YgfZ